MTGSNAAMITSIYSLLIRSRRLGISQAHVTLFYSKSSTVWRVLTSQQLFVKEIVWMAELICSEILSMKLFEELGT